MGRLKRVITCVFLGGAIACGGGNDAAPAPARPGDYAACARQEAQCETTCESRELPGSSDKEPASRGDIEAERCRESCRSQCGSGSGQ